MEADGETPWDACRREVREECGLEVRGGRLACVDFRPGRPGRPGGIRFLFDCGPAGDADLAAITVQPEEIAEYRLLPLDEALPLLRPPIRRRVRAGTRRRRCVYLENGRPVVGIRLRARRAPGAARAGLSDQRAGPVSWPRVAPKGPSPSRAPGRGTRGW
jgi:8-oxo-dGTP diphosphatase